MTARSKIILKLGENDYEVSVLGSQFSLFKVFMIRRNPATPP